MLFVGFGGGDHALVQMRLSRAETRVPATAAIDDSLTSLHVPQPHTTIVPGDGSDDRATSGGSGLFTARTFSTATVCAGQALGGLVVAAAAGLLI